MKQIETFVVLMLENRCFDHMLGFLSHSDKKKFPRLKQNDPDFSNPLNPLKPNENLVYATDQGDQVLVLDPPHSHASVMNQMNVPLAGDPKMNGFVGAYSRKAARAEEGIPRIFWLRLFALASVIVVLLNLLFLVFAAQHARVIVVGLAVGLLLALLLWGGTREFPGMELKPTWIGGLIGGCGAAGLPFWLIDLRMSAPLACLSACLLLILIAGLVIWWIRRKHLSPKPVVPDPGPKIMRCMNETQDVPVLSRLAKEFAVCTRWHCSVPGATWPNRNFLHSGTSDGTVDIVVDFYDDETIFDRLGDDWRIYYDGLPQVGVFNKLWDTEERRANWREFSEFETDVRDLPKYVFIEPSHDGPRSNSQHPGNNEEHHNTSDFARGEQLIAKIYETLRNATGVFEKTALIITYDEHGGFYDHVAPPRDAIDPKPLGRPQTAGFLGRLVSTFVQPPTSKTPFKFTMLGPRVPTVIVSPWIRAGTISDRLYDHTSLPATIRKRFAPGSDPLSEREAEAETFEEVFNLKGERTDLPDLSQEAAAAEFDVLDAGTETWTPRDDDFSRGLQALAEKLDPRIPADVSGPQFDVLGETAQRTEVVAARFTEWARQSR